ncbi:uncharacterized protein AB675_11369 [Cyphellophora attinorum]|uniref:LITAF domain-containing protein n=1 Tax=Cyphellophora attinorum TaxID=1664694 RepID=A0A0N0NMD9_9EURO|nr:uncharacterized protein AB675_11369 [Phialophora attinorum]KPI40089.1 hypothetical protein AB675_11369 [Phialophora attinorum]
MHLTASTLLALTLTTLGTTDTTSEPTLTLTLIDGNRSTVSLITVPQSSFTTVNVPRTDPGVATVPREDPFIAARQVITAKCITTLIIPCPTCKTTTVGCSSTPPSVPAAFTGGVGRRDMLAAREPESAPEECLPTLIIPCPTCETTTVLPGDCITTPPAPTFTGGVGRRHHAHLLAREREPAAEAGCLTTLIIPCPTCQTTTVLPHDCTPTPALGGGVGKRTIVAREAEPEPEPQRTTLVIPCPACSTTTLIGPDGPETTA